MNRLASLRLANARAVNVAVNAPSLNVAAVGPQARRFFQQLVGALAHCHRDWPDTGPFCHRDIKPENVLLGGAIPTRPKDP